MFFGRHPYDPYPAGVRSRSLTSDEEEPWEERTAVWTKPFFKKGPRGLLKLLKLEYCMICGFVLIQIHSYEYILVQCMHNHFVIEVAVGCLWALAGCGPL